MDKKEKISEKIKEGVSVQELENFAKKYTSELFSALALFIATISSLFDFFTGSGWSVLFAGLGAIAGLLFPNQINTTLGKFYDMVQKQEKMTQIIIGSVKIVIAVFVPFVLFTIIALLGGASSHLHTSGKSKNKIGDSTE